MRDIISKLSEAKVNWVGFGTFPTMIEINIYNSILFKSGIGSRKHNFLMRSIIHDGANICNISTAYDDS